MRTLDTALAVVLTAAVMTALFSTAGRNPFALYHSLFAGSLAGIGLVTTLQQTVPVVGLGLALSFSFRAGQFNLGAAGQFVGGGVGGTAVALTMPGPGWLVIGASLLAAMVVGAALSTICAALFTALGAPVFATSLLLNYPIISTSSYLIKVTMKDPTSSMDASRLIPTERRIGVIGPPGGSVAHLFDSVFGQYSTATLIVGGLNWSVLIVAVIWALVVFINARLPIGFETRLIGLSPDMARSSGIRSDRAILVNMAIGGAITGLMGIVVVLGTHFRLIDGALDGTGYPITALLVVLLARNRAVAVVVVGFLFTALGVGGEEIERDYGLSSYVSTIVQALVVFLVSIKLTPRVLARRWGVRR
ncbi:nucleoside ABC transporter membrane protein [Williamsia sterculiae]|uniref:Nucleoside ABC transporter membrane protein n=1 Tax=Williamsia sterculiae TaxID=1344003 RepID=A0A1N7EJZ7_9NOCA|nr:nucleoside ABC transporter membrane protein [Williamsia sterculiae]